MTLHWPEVRRGASPRHGRRPDRRGPGASRCFLRSSARRARATGHGHRVLPAREEASCTALTRGQSSPAWCRRPDVLSVSPAMAAAGLRRGARRRGRPLPGFARARPKSRGRRAPPGDNLRPHAGVPPRGGGPLVALRAAAPDTRARRIASDRRSLCGAHPRFLRRLSDPRDGRPRPCSPLVRTSVPRRPHPDRRVPLHPDALRCFPEACRTPTRSDAREKRPRASFPA